MKLAILGILLLSNASFAKEMVKVAVIDTGLDLRDQRFTSHLCKSGHKDFTNTTLDDVDGHGTHVAGSIVQNAKNSNYCLVIFKFYSSKLPKYATAYNFFLALEESRRQNITLINYSGGGSVFFEPEYLFIRNNPEIKIFAAAGNESLNLDFRYNHFYPASYGFKNVIVVGSTTEDGLRSSFSNYGKVVKFWEIGSHVQSFDIGSGFISMSGTSMATAVHMGKYLNENYR